MFRSSRSPGPTSSCSGTLVNSQSFPHPRSMHKGDLRISRPEDTWIYEDEAEPLTSKTDFLEVNEVSRRMEEGGVGFRRTVE